MKATIFIPGLTPSKKNSKKIVQIWVRGKAGRRRRVPKIVSSDLYTAWAKENIYRLKQHDLVGHTWRYPLRVGFHYTRDSHRRFDYNNLNQGPLDLLVEAGIIEDDSMKFVVPNGDLSYEVCKAKAKHGVVITLEEINE